MVKNTHLLVVLNRLESENNESQILEMGKANRERDNAVYLSDKLGTG